MNIAVVPEVIASLHRKDFLCQELSLPENA
jgi:hypothetical protein